MTDPKKILRQERSYLWHPNTQMRDWVADEPLFIADGEGVKVRDLQGREYYDANSSLWVNVHGHRKAEIDQAIIAQLGRIAHSTFLGLSHAPAAELAERLVRIAPPGLSRVFYSDSGSEAIEIALKMAFQYWQHRGEPDRHLYVALEEGYHGDTLGSVSVGCIPLFHAIYKKLLFPVRFAPNPARARTAEEAADGLESLLKEHRGQIAGVILEPLVQAAAGMLVAKPGYLARVRELCDRYDTLLIADEVATGFGRTGRMFACEHEGVTPDLMCVAKGITGGYLPLAATLTTERIYEAFLGEYREVKTFFHGHSYTANPLCCAAALANLDVFEQERVIEGLVPKIEAIAQALEAYRDLPHVKEIRHCGLMVGIELVKNRETGEPYAWEEAVGVRVCRRARTMGLITRPLGNTVVFFPPLASTPEQLCEMLDIIRRAISEEAALG